MTTQFVTEENIDQLNSCGCCSAPVLSSPSRVRGKNGWYCNKFCRQLDENRNSKGEIVMPKECPACGKFRPIHGSGPYCKECHDSIMEQYHWEQQQALHEENQNRIEEEGGIPF